MLDFLEQLFKPKPTKVNVKWNDWNFPEYTPIPFCSRCERVLSIDHIWCPRCGLFLV